MLSLEGEPGLVRSGSPHSERGYLSFAAFGSGSRTRRKSALIAVMRKGVKLVVKAGVAERPPVNRHLCAWRVRAGDGSAAERMPGEGTGGLSPGRGVGSI